MTCETQVIVIGGGATGVATARDLAMRGVDVTLFERDGLSAGTTGRSHGVLHSGARYAESDPAGAADCARENRVLRRIGGSCVADTGGVFLRLEGDDPDYFDTKLEACLDAGISAERTDQTELRDRVSGLTPNVEAAMTVPDGIIYPSRLVAATAADARNRGARIRTHTPVTDLLVDNGTVVGAQFDGGRQLRADMVVNAAGAWAGQCAALAGVELRMRPTKGVMITVEHGGVEPVLNRCRPPADGDIVVPHPNTDHVVLGTTSVAVDDPDDYPKEADEVSQVVKECAEMVPGLGDAPTVREYWGVRPLYEPDEVTRESERGISRDFALLDHGTADADRFLSIVGGKLTTHRAMAEEVADQVCRRLEEESTCMTAETRLPAADNPRQLDRFVAEFDAVSPADADVVAGD